MTGRASAELICKAKVRKPIDNPLNRLYTEYYEGYCGQVTRPDLRKVGEFIQLFEPDGWHVEIAADPADTIVRCPEHCELIVPTWAEMRDAPRDSIPVPQWRDAP